MEQTVVLNGSPSRTLPELIVVPAADAARIPAPGTMRALKAETGRTWAELCGEDADPADRFQTLIWQTLRRTIPDLRWDECDGVDVRIEEGAGAVDPTKLVASATSLPSAGSGD